MNGPSTQTPKPKSAANAPSYMKRPRSIRLLRTGPAFDDGWKPPPRAIPFGPFLVLGTLEVLLLPDIFADLFTRLSAWLLGSV